MGSNQANKVKVLCGACGAQLAVVRAFLDPYDPAAEPGDFTGTGWRDWFDADWGEGWRYQYDELNRGETITRSSLLRYAADGRRPSFDGWQVVCTVCGSDLQGHLPELVELLREAFAKGGRRQTVRLSRSEIDRVRPDHRRDGEKRSVVDLVDYLDGNPRTFVATLSDGTQETITISAQIVDPADCATDQTDDPS